jgi:ubiquinone biosynthesis protein
MFFKALLTTEGLAKNLIPEVDPLETARPYVERLVAERFSPARLKEDLFYNLVTASSLLNRLPTTVSQVMDDLDQQRLHMSVRVAEDESTRSARSRGERLLSYTLLACTGLLCGTTSLFLDAPTVGGHRVLPILFFTGGGLALFRVVLAKRRD